MFGAYPVLCISMVVETVKCPDRTLDIMLVSSVLREVIKSLLIFVDCYWCCLDLVFCRGICCLLENWAELPLARGRFDIFFAHKLVSICIGFWFPHWFLG